VHVEQPTEQGRDRDALSIRRDLDTAPQGRRDVDGEARELPWLMWLWGIWMGLAVAKPAFNARISGRP
jgi:hypothetical protein